MAFRLSQYHLNLSLCKNGESLLLPHELSPDYLCETLSSSVCTNESGVSWKSSFFFLPSHPSFGLDPNGSSFVTSEVCTKVFCLPLVSLISVSCLCHLTPEFLQPFLWLSLISLCSSFSAVFCGDGRWIFSSLCGVCFLLLPHSLPWKQIFLWGIRFSIISLSDLQKVCICLSLILFLFGKQNSSLC